MPPVADRTRIVYWALAGALLFAGFYLSFYGELPPHLLLAGAMMAVAGPLVFGGRKIWTILLGIPVAVCVAFLLDALVGL